MLNCTASGYPAPVITVSSVEQDDFTNLEVDNGIAIISKETKWNQQIVCIASNGVKPVQNTRQDVIRLEQNSLIEVIF